MTTYTGDAWRYCENLSDPEAVKQVVQAALTTRSMLDFALTKIDKDEFGTVPDWLAVKRALDAALKAVGHGIPPSHAPAPAQKPSGFRVQVAPTDTCHDENYIVSDIHSANTWSIYTGAPGNYSWVADFALTQKDAALHFAADLAVRLGYGMDRSAVDVVEANEERDLSHEEGWGMFEVDGRWMLQRFEGIFDSDVDALMWVAQQAIDGSARHRVALRKIGSLA
jgi:hypothetical protein